MEIFLQPLKMRPVFDKFQQSIQKCLRFNPIISSNDFFASPSDNIKPISVSKTDNLVQERAKN